jgi:hypothetical protein
LGILKTCAASPSTKNAESQAVKNMASKTAAGLKRHILGLYNDLAEMVKSKEASLCEIVGSEEGREAEGFSVT